MNIQALNREYICKLCLLILSRLCRRPFSSPEPLGLLRALGTRMDGCRHECRHVRHHTVVVKLRSRVSIYRKYWEKWRVHGLLLQ